MVACHRLRNRKRVLVKFQDLADREAVYQARFDQKTDDKDKTIVVHENLTERRAAQIRVLGKLRRDEEIANYHTRNGTIYARISTDRKYAKIDPMFTKDEIMQTLENTETQLHRERDRQTTHSRMHYLESPTEGAGTLNALRTMWWSTQSKMRSCRQDKK